MDERGGIRMKNLVTVAGRSKMAKARAGIAALPAITHIALGGSMSILWAQKVELFSQHNICRENYFLGC